MCRRTRINGWNYCCLMAKQDAEPRALPKFLVAFSPCNFMRRITRMVCSPQSRLKKLARQEIILVECWLAGVLGQLLDARVPASPLAPANAALSFRLSHSPPQTLIPSRDPTSTHLNPPATLSVQHRDTAWRCSTLAAFASPTVAWAVRRHVFAPGALQHRSMCPCAWHEWE